ncbi:hypothetical protein [Aeribacillus pallidus]|uniref:Uncharacterized protein n=1 Tax=Aeribacillus pallidus TaxID=33936 RepID=A0A165YG75_9BACI|nr:hypothetical protein [Aeribacillus pallidus]KZN97044.1 hypothetical protein AZI98_05625 [Aeribacillus pallidus]
MKNWKIGIIFPKNAIEQILIVEILRLGRQNHKSDAISGNNFAGKHPPAFSDKVENIQKQVEKYELFFSTCFIILGISRNSK